MLFRSTHDLHGLGPQWERPLLVAALFRDSGKSISHLDYPCHSAHILKTVRFPGLSPAEKGLVAELCRDFRFMEPDGVSVHDLSSSAPKGLKVLLRVVDEIDLPESKCPVVKKVAVSEQQVRLRLSPCPNLELRQLRVARTNALFLETFGRQIALE